MCATGKYEELVPMETPVIVQSSSFAGCPQRLGICHGRKKNMDHYYNSRHCLQEFPKTSKKSKTMQKKHKLLVASILILIIAIYCIFSIVLSAGNKR